MGYGEITHVGLIIITPVVCCFKVKGCIVMSDSTKEPPNLSEELDTIIDAVSNDTIKTDEPSQAEEVTGETNCGSAKTFELLQTEKDAVNAALALERRPIELSKEDIKAFQALVDEEKAKLPRLKEQKIAVSKKSISLYKSDEQGKDVKWARIVVVCKEKEYIDCNLIIGSGGKSFRYAVGSLKECLERADIVSWYA